MSEYWKEAKQGADADAVSRRDGPGEAGEPERGSGSDVPWEGVPEGADAARRLCDQTARPKGPEGPTPDEAWGERQRLTETERKAFDNEVRTRLNEAWGLRQRIRTEADDPKAGVRDATLMRDAVRRALAAGGYLKYRRRRIPLLP
jgi:hypothetical protein